MVWARNGEGLGRGETWVGGRAEPVQAGKRTSSAVRSHVAPNRPPRSAAPLTARAPSRDRPTRLYPRLYFGFTRREWRNLADAPDLGSGARKGVGVQIPPLAPLWPAPTRKLWSETAPWSCGRSRR